jgi:hypothetical protein
MEQITDSNETPLKSWVIIFVLALLFVAWGLFIFFTVGDKGPPAWDFGTVQDIPGESPYSTLRTMGGKEAAPEPQHVLEKPSQVEEKPRKEKP